MFGFANPYWGCNESIDRDWNGCFDHRDVAVFHYEKLSANEAGIVCIMKRMY